MAEHYSVSVGSGSLVIDDGFAMDHEWTGAGVTFDAPFTGGHLLHLAVAGCVLNDVYREAGKLGVTVNGVRVTAQGSFDDETGRSPGIEYDVAIDSAMTVAEVDRLLALVDESAEIPRALRHGAPVRRGEGA
jgi:uncharacterized OsmC-like protein